MKERLRRWVPMAVLLIPALAVHAQTTGPLLPETKLAGVAGAPSATQETFTIALQHFDISEKVVAEQNRLGALKVRVPGHGPAGMPVGLRAQGCDQVGDLDCELAGSSTAIEP